MSLTFFNSSFYTGFKVFQFLSVERFVVLFFFCFSRPSFFFLSFFFLSFFLSLLSVFFLPCVFLHSCLAPICFVCFFFFKKNRKMDLVELVDIRSEDRATLRDHQIFSAKVLVMV